MAVDMERIEAGEDLTTELKREYTEEIKKTIVAFWAEEILSPQQQGRLQAGQAAPLPLKFRGRL